MRKRAEAFAAAAGAASIDEALIMAAKAARDRPSAAAASPVALAVAPVAVGTWVAPAYPSSFREQFELLLARSWREATRGKVATFVKVRTRPLATSILVCVIMRRAVNRAGGAASVNRGDLRRHLHP